MRSAPRDHRLDRFLRERPPAWRDLARLLDRAEAGDHLGASGLRELLAAYRSACTDLNRARHLTVDPQVVDQLNRLCGRAYRFVHGGLRRGWSRRALGPFFWQAVPAALRRARRDLAIAAFCMLLGALLGAVAVGRQPHLGPSLIPPQFFTESPAERVAGIETEEERIQNLEAASSFSATLFTHNIQVTLLAFGLGAITVIGGWWLLCYNGLILGAIATMYLQDGVGVFFLAWVGPHGVIELPAIIVGAAAGLRFGKALWLPGERGRRARIAERLPDTARLLTAAAGLLIVAGLIEGSFSQFSAKTVPYGIKIGFATIAGLLVAAYLAGLGARETEQA